MAVSNTAAATSVINWIEEILEERGWSASELARKSELAPSTILRMMNDPNHRFTPSLTTLRKIASAAGAELPPGILSDRQDLTTGESMADSRPASIKVADRTTASETVELRRVSSLPNTLQPKRKSGSDVPRPPHLLGDDTAFAFWMPNGDLEPWVPAGSLVFASQRRDPKEGDLAVVTRKDCRTMVRLVASLDEDGLTLRGSNEESSGEVVPFEDMQELHVVLAWMRD